MFACAGLHCTPPTAASCAAAAAAGAIARDKGVQSDGAACIRALNVTCMGAHVSRSNNGEGDWGGATEMANPASKMTLHARSIGWQVPGGLGFRVWSLWFGV